MLIQLAIASHDWAGVYPVIHNFCAADLSAFYFDIRKDSLYCDRPDALKRRACRTVLDILHRCLTAWLAPVLPFTAEDSWTSRFGEDSSVHTTLFPSVPETWRDEELATKWNAIRHVRTEITGAIEQMRRDKRIGSSLQAEAFVASDAFGLLSAQEWADTCIVSKAGAGAEDGAAVAFGEKCERCWRVLEEVGANHRHPTLCLRCVEAVA